MTERLETDPYQVLNTAVDIESGQLVAPTILETIRQRNIRLVIVYGDPGAGKSTWLAQLIKRLEESSDKPLRKRALLFDNVLARVIREKGRTTDLWQNSDWDDFSKTMLVEIMVGLPQRSRTGYQDIQFVETLSIGRKFNRAVSTLIELAAIVNEDLPEEQDVLFVGKVADYRSQLRATQMRLAFAEKPGPGFEFIADSQVRGELERQFRIEAVGYDDSPESGRELRATIMRMAPPERMKLFDDEIAREIITWGGVDDYRQKLTLAVPKEVEAFPPYRREEFILKALYMHFNMRNILSLSPQIGFLSYSPHLENQKVLWYPKALRS